MSASLLEDRHRKGWRIPVQTNLCLHRPWCRYDPIYVLDYCLPNNCRSDEPLVSMRWHSPGICCKLYAFLNLVELSSIAVCSTNLIVCGRHLPPSHHNSASLALQQPRLTMTATKSSFPAITSPEATQEDDNEKDSILVFVSTSCENGKKAPVFIRKFNPFPQMYPFP